MIKKQSERTFDCHFPLLPHGHVQSMFVKLDSGPGDPATVKVAKVFAEMMVKDAGSK